MKMTGISLRHPASSLASLGLLAVFPDAKINFTRHEGSHVVTLATNENIIEKLSNKAYWKKLLVPTKDFCVKQKELFLEEFQKLYEIDPDLAMGIGTDQRIFKPKPTKPTKKKNNVYVAKQPFNLLQRTDTFNPKINKIIRSLDPVEIEKTLLKYPWEKIAGCHFNLFPEEISCNAFNNKFTPKGQKKSKSEQFTVPIITLLAVASWRLLPVYLNGKQSITHGINERSIPVYFNGVKCNIKEKAFYFPVFTKELDAKTYVNWLLHPELPEFAKNRATWQKIGVDAVCKIKFADVEKGFCLGYPKTL